MSSRATRCRRRRTIPRAEHEFTAGWIALRFANNAKAAYQHFARVGEGTSNPITLARGDYWQGRAAEALGRTSEARAHYQAAAQHSTAYYGQLARARLGLGELPLRRPPEPDQPRRADEPRSRARRAASLRRRRRAISLFRS
jgi:soluble lytic murein transglycosylase